MAEWGRDTQWRQGHVLSDAAVTAFGLSSPEKLGETVVVVVSHDCDLAQLPDVEPDVEIIVGRRLTSADGNCTYSKNARRLHLPFSNGNERLTADLLATGKRRVAKSDLAAFAPVRSISITVSERATLQRWLAARYRRAAFPDEFDRRLDTTGLRDRLAKILKSRGVFVSAVFFDVDRGEDIDRSGQPDPYSVSVYLLYNTETDPEAAEEAANAAAGEIRKAFLDRCFSKQSNSWVHVELVECEAIADQAMTMLQAEQLKRWSANHVSLKAGAQHSILRDE
jgi:hypothetical protein